MEPTATPESRTESKGGGDWWPRAAIALTTLACGSVNLVYPFGNDQLTYCFYGDALLHGKVLYRDIPMIQMPMLGVVHALALVLFGRHMTSIRILDLLWTLATALVIYQLVRKGFRGRWLAITAGALYSILYYLNDWWQTAQPDGFLNLPIAAACLLLLHELTSDRSATPARARHSPRDVLPGLGAGVLIGLALLFKYPIAFMLPSLALMPFFVWGWRSPRARRTSGWLVLGCLFTLCAFLSALAVTGAFPDFVRAQIGLLMPYTHAGSSALNPAAKLLTMFRTLMPLIQYQPMVGLGFVGVAAGIGMLLTLGPGRTRQTTGLVLLWLLSALLSIYGQGKMLHYTYEALLPPVAILGALALAAVFRRLWTRLEHVALKSVLFFATVLGLLTLTVYHERFGQLWALLRGKTSLSAYWRSSSFYFGDFSVAENLAVNDYVAESTAPEDRVADFALYPQQTFPVWRDPVVRFSTSYNEDPPSWKLPDELRNNPPELFIVRHDDRVPWVRGHNMDSYEQLMAFPELRTMVLDNYELEIRIGHADVLRRANSDRELPAVVTNPKALDADLREALQFISPFDSSDYRTVLWPVAVPSAPPANADPRMRGIYSKLTSQRSYNQSVWLGQTRPAARLPMLSVWIKGDDRPLSVQFPFASQDEGRNIIDGPYRLTLLHSCGQGVVQVFLIDSVPPPKQ